MKNFWKSKIVVVTGGSGFLGIHLVKKLLKLKPAKIVIPNHKKTDLRDYRSCLKAFKNADIVIHLAGNVGGIGYNQSKPAELFDDNIIMGINIMRAAKACNVQKVVLIGTICAYPKFTPVPFKEEHLWDGYPEETNAPYGLAKKMLLVQSQAYRKQYGFNSIYLLPVNMYGPGDNFDPTSSHVIPALIKKFAEARNTKSKKVVIWGSGKPTREFLYVDDAAEGILKACEKYNKPDPINLGSGFEISIKELARTISKMIGFKGSIIFDKSKPDGQPRRRLYVGKAIKEFGFKAKTDFKTGLKKTIEDYLKREN
ncbi:MAG: GDP-L-fucose synthase [Candidatus Woesebacteria bacterium]|nr:MAG: GDP-L-fucose synthase [Candidatus Woesebacteria bacterium]